MKKFLAVIAIMFLVTSCTTKKEEVKKTSENNTKVETTKKAEDNKTAETKTEEKKEVKSELNSNLVEGLEFTFITDKEEKITKELNLVETIGKQITSTPQLKGAKLTNLDFSDEKAKEILNSNEIKELPVLLVNKNKWEKDKPANEYLKETKGGLFIVQPGFYNFETKKYTLELGSLCSNKIDDNGNGKKDCEEDTCLQSNPKGVCDAEIKKLQEEYKKKQEEAQKKAKEAQAEKLKNLKAVKPKVDLYVMSYCPYGTQAEKPFLEVMKTFKDSAEVDIKFVQYTMHGEKEGKENTRQHCVKTTQKEKFNDYLACFLKDGKSDECLKSTKIDIAKVDTCMKETEEKFKIDYAKTDYAINKETAEKAGVQGSPTLVIEGVKIDGVARNARAYAEVICKVFKKAPAVCSDLSKISDKTFAPGFGFEAPTAASNAQAAAGCAAPQK